MRAINLIKDFSKTQERALKLSQLDDDVRLFRDGDSTVYDVKQLKHEIDIVPKIE